MNSEFYEKEVPVLSREDAIAILNTPDEDLDVLIDRAKSLRYRYKGNRVSIHILTNARSGNCSQDCAYCAQSCRSTADIDKYKWVDEDKLYQDNDFVNEYHLSRHCIGLSGMKFTDKEIEELARRIRCNSLFLRIRQRHKAYSVGQSRKNFCIHIDLPPNTFYNVWYSRTIQQMMWRKMLCEASRSSALLSFRSRTINCILAFQSWNLTGCSRLCMRLTVRSISARPALPRSL